MFKLTLEFELSYSQARRLLQVGLAVWLMLISL
jgi:hypothetical protein